MGVLWKVTKEGWVKPVTLSADPAGVLEGFAYYNNVLKGGKQLIAKILEWDSVHT